MKHLLTRVLGRADFSIIADFISEGSNVLDLGCGNGDLLHYLIRNKNIKGTGVEISLDRIESCIAKGIPVIHHDLNSDFKNINDKTYDYVILSQTIQEVQHPARLIEEILRIGKYGIISFPNFGNKRIRLGLLFHGRMPKTEDLPFEWYDTPNIHLMTYSDFIDFCRKNDILIHETIHIIANRYKTRVFLPNLFSEGCVLIISK